MRAACRLVQLSGGCRQPPAHPCLPLLRPTAPLPRSRIWAPHLLLKEVGALWRARPRLDFRYRHDPEDEDWELEGGPRWEHPWGYVEDGCLQAWDGEYWLGGRTSHSGSSESSWDGSSDAGTEFEPELHADSSDDVADGWEGAESPSSLVSADSSASDAGGSDGGGAG